jgi:hypothetical protein
VAIGKVPNVESNIKFEELVKSIRESPDLAPHYQAIKAEAEQHSGAGDAMDLS